MSKLNALIARLLCDAEAVGAGQVEVKVLVFSGRAAAKSQRA